MNMNMLLWLGVILMLVGFLGHVFGFVLFFDSIHIFMFGAVMSALLPLMNNMSSS